jgi:hypothetical protein
MEFEDEVIEATEHHEREAKLRAALRAEHALPRTPATPTPEPEPSLHPALVRPRLRMPYLIAGFMCTAVMLSIAAATIAEIIQRARDHHDDAEMLARIDTPCPTGSFVSAMGSSGTYECSSDPAKSGYVTVGNATQALTKELTNLNLNVRSVGTYSLTDGLSNVRGGYAAKQCATDIANSHVSSLDVPAGCSAIDISTANPGGIELVGLHLAEGMGPTERTRIVMLHFDAEARIYSENANAPADERIDAGANALVAPPHTAMQFIYDGQRWHPLALAAAAY